MPALTPLSAAQRVAQALEIQRLRADGLTVNEACEQVGMSPRNYYDWIARGDETIQVLRDTLAESERIQLTEIEAARMELLRRMIAMIDEVTRPADAVLLDSHLLSLQRELEDRHGAHGVGDEVANEFLLHGPRLTRAPNRMTGSSTTVNVKALPDGSVDVTLVPPSSPPIDISPGDE